mgnify:FL=1|jgi:predicted RNA binding protein with dsRBD fold (UPF0201 family)
MKIPNFKCKIIVNCEINPSEEFDKVSKALNNIFPSLEILEDKNSINLISEKLDSLENIFENIHSTNSQKTFLRNLDKNLKKESTWFYLNKQAAFVNKVVICEDSIESPLGPIKITIFSKQIDSIIDWVASESD